MAHHQRLKWQGDLTLDTTALVHEAYLKLVDQKRVVADSRAHFFAVAAKAMRHILCNYARDRRRLKRGGDIQHVSLEAAERSTFAIDISDDQAEELSALDEALARLEAIDGRQSEIVECRFFGGLSIEDTAAALQISPASVKRGWVLARSWLYHELRGARAPATGYLEKLGEEVVAPAQWAVVGAARDRDDSRLREKLASALGASYRIERQLPRGGMSRVFLAEEIGLERMVVIKVLSAEMRQSVSAERFRREMQLAARLQHPRIVPLLGTGSTESLLYYTMPFVEGESLKEHLSRVGQLPLNEAVRIWRDVLEALAHAHANGIVHRDVKPANILLDQGNALVTDFGIARAIKLAAEAQEAGAGGEQRLTETGVIIGTPAYMAPEHAAGDRSTDHRADIYSAGLVMYEMLAGRSPFHGASGTDLVRAHFARVPDSLSRPDLPGNLGALVLRCLAKSPAERPQSAELIVAELGTMSV